MWPGEQSSGAGQHPPHPQSNPYQQHPTQPQGYQPYAQQQTQSQSRSPLPPPGGGGDGSGWSLATQLVVGAAAVAVVGCAVTGFLVLGGDGDDKVVTKPTATATPGRTPSADARPGTDRGPAAEPTPVVPGWKTVVNPQLGIAFDVPQEWDRKASSWVSYVADAKDETETPLVGFTAPGVLQEKWCTSDDDKDGNREETALASAGSRGERKAASAADAARETARLWLYGAYTQPDRSRANATPAEPFTTSSGIKGSLASAASSGVPKKGKCSTDGKVTTFAFTGSRGTLVSWSFVGAKGVPQEVPDATVRKIVGTVRLVGAK
ncbi:hypothetical protein OG897_12985 [Streptomyces sp. NBC_00237]|uniref:hypothetical protein n=1 Tax=Streptomyces sp. NBC_00237 TaxID=2975687 RepID=UPI00225291CC|nr:hypothetical protein [Streptomyces sp. NBC_00237]MCX5202361.1 hypothetical protein [Streptomyces sp. NBC_00237]